MMRSRQLQRLVLVVLLFGAMFALGMSRAYQPLEHGLQNLASSLRERPASGRLHVVEMDAASMAAIRRWPLPREHHAAVIDRLSAAGVRSITFDVDFSAHSTPEQDRLLARSLARSAVQVVLPTFAQQAGSGDKRELDTMPLPLFRSHVALASVSVLPELDGIVRKMPLGTLTQGIPRPSLAAQIAHRSGTAHDKFPIDFGIDPQTIPRHSFISIEQGRFDAAALRGKDVLIGGTAVEMADRYVVPRHGVIPGVIVQALAAETLYAGVPREGGWFVPLLLAAGMLWWILAARSLASTFRRGLIGIAIVLQAKFLAFSTGYILLELVPSLSAITLGTGLHMLLLFNRQMQEKRLIDAESGLPNRRALHREARPADSRYTVAAMIDGFDALKSVLGEEDVGQLIARLAERLRTAGWDGAIYRVDDRALAWTTRLEHYELDDALTGLRALMRAPVEVAGRRVDVTLAFGIAEAGQVAEATHAASMAQREGVHWRYHKDAEQSALEQQVSLMGELDDAIRRDELRVVYQPKLELATDRISSVEALVRWEHPERGFLRPDSFIPLAEQSDRIADLTLYVLQKTIDDLRAWCARDFVITAAVNISARLVSSPQFIAAAEAVLTATGVPRDRLVFEVTESAAMDDHDAAREALNRFRKLGVAISMDDYGTGQSTLAYIKNLPLSELKIDRSFVQFAHRDQGDALLVRSTVQLAHELGLKVVAEGVEDAECLAFLRKIECDYAQGYFIGKPMPADELIALAQSQARQAA